MRKYEYDIKKTMEIVNDLESARCKSLYILDNLEYSKLYTISNENLKELFDSFSVKDKEVLSVLASSDQLFCAYYKGAKSVDTFDVNFLTEYYYYLRKWLIDYKNQLRPRYDKLMLDSSWIGNLLGLVNCQSEGEETAYKYWCLYVRKTLGIHGEGIFRTGWCWYDFFIDDVAKMKELLKDKELSFHQQEISGKINKDKKYDVIILSNMLEYAFLDAERLKRIRDNLYDILKDDGQIIASHLLSCVTEPREAEIFREKFDLHDFALEQEITLSPGYCYTKK